MAADHRGLTVACLVLRLATAAALAAALSLIATNTVFYYFDPGTKIRFKNMIGYRYVLATSSIGLLYTLLQVPITIFLLFTKEKMEGVPRLLEFSMYGDKGSGTNVPSQILSPMLLSASASFSACVLLSVISFLLATGVGAGFLDSIDLRRLVHELERDNLVVSEVRLKIDKYVARAIISSAFLLVGAIFMATTSVIFTVIRIKAKTRGGFFA